MWLKYVNSQDYCKFKDLSTSQLHLPKASDSRLVFSCRHTAVEFSSKHTGRFPGLQSLHGQQQHAACLEASPVQGFKRVGWSSGSFDQQGESHNSALSSYFLKNQDLRVLFTVFALQSLHFSNPAASVILETILEVRLDSFTTDDFNNPAVVQLWFNHYLLAFLPSVSTNFLSCLTRRGLSCSTYQQLWV